MTFQDFITLLEAKGLKPRQLANGQWQAHCPAHDDAKPSLSVTESDERILVKCFAGCAVDAICAALGISVADLFVRENDGSRKRTERIVAVYDYRDANGQLVFQTVRYEPKRFAYRQPDNGKWRWNLEGIPRPLPLYRLPELLQADPQKPVFVVEGEKDADNLWQHGLVATTNPMGAEKWSQVDDKPLEGRQVVVLPDNDEAGRRHAEQVARSLYGRAASVRIVHLPDLPPKGDVSDWLAAGHTVAELLQLVAQTPEWHPPQLPTLSDTPLNGNAPQREHSTCPYCDLTADELLALSRPILDAQNPVADAAQRLCDAAGIVAEDDNAQLLLLIATTRILPNPVHALVVGTTGAGKSALVNAISAAIPPCHRRTLIGTSARALLVHPLKPATLLNWLELPNLDSESIASTILRALLWQDNTDSADYLLTEWVGGRAKARTLKLPRQIALLSTRVDLPKDEQLVTRLFIVEVKETPEKRQSVLSAIARQWQDSERPDPDALRQPVVAFMEWAQRRTWRVVIPFADALMALLSQLPSAERDYRDAANLLRLIAASAIWHFQRRQHAITDEGVTVVADLDDYALVHQLVAPAFAKTRAFALSEGERQIVDALRANDAPMTVKEIAQATNLSPTAVRCRLNRLKAKEIVADEQSPERREKVWRVVASATFVSDLLPTPDQVRAHWCPDPTSPPKNFQTNLSPTEESSSVHAFMSVHDPRTLENAKQDWDFCTSVHAFAEHSVQVFADHYQGKSHQDEAILAANSNVIENGERANASLKTLSSISENERSRPLNACERTNAADSGLEVKVTCPRCGSWRRVPPDALMLADPLCDICGSVMKPEPEDNEERYIDTGSWVASFFEGSNEPAVFDLETNEAIPVAFPNLPVKEARCPRCGHREAVDPEVLLPPLCPACGTTMDWEVHGDG